MIKTQVLIHDKDFRLSNCKFDLNTHFNGKPKEALWTSTYINEEEISEWYKWCKYEDFHLKDCLYLLEPKEDIKVLEIDSLKNLKGLSTVVIFNQFCLDFNSLYKMGYSGVHLSDKGLINIRNNNDYISFKLPSSFWGWDCESTVWFNTEWIKSFEFVRRINRE